MESVNEVQVRGFSKASGHAACLFPYRPGLCGTIDACIIAPSAEVKRY